MDNDVMDAHTERSPLPDQQLNFSRKRPHAGQHDEKELPELPNEEARSGRTPKKRARSSNWPLSSTDGIDKENMAARASTELSRDSGDSDNSRRPSKFHEASMHDRPSEKPPSMFTRFFHSNSNQASPVVDHLMEDYAAAAGGSGTVKVSRRHASRSSPVKSASSSRPPPTAPSVTSAATEDSRQSGIFRFGRSIASSFNPLNAWSKLRNNFDETKEVMTKENLAKLDDQTKLMKVRKAQAEQAYAAMKKSGQFGAKVMHRTGDTSVEAEPASQRDSGIQMDDPRASADLSDSEKGASRFVGTLRGRSRERKAASFHFRSPSLTNLKKMKSDITLAAKSTTSLPSEKDANADPAGTLRREKSKKDLQRQNKLVKRVSDLETKLEEARRELNNVLGDAPPVPPLPEIASANTNRRRHGRYLGKPGFNILPSLPSERLLLPEQHSADGAVGCEQIDEAEQELLQQVKSREDELSEIQGQLKNKRSIDELSKELSKAPSDDAVTGAEPTAAPISDPTPAAQSSVSKDDEAQPNDDNAEAQPVVYTKKHTLKKNTKRITRPVSLDDKVYKPTPSSASDSEFSNPPSRKSSQKRKHVVSKTSSPLKASPSNRKQTNPRTTTSPSNSPPKKIVKTAPKPRTRPSTLPANGAGLSTVREETTMTVPLKNAPSRPTAMATPAHPKHGNVPSSPAGVLSSPGVARRSASPPPSDSLTPAARVSEDGKVAAKPGRGVPLMPGKGGKVGDDFEWPEDCF